MNAIAKLLHKSGYLYKMASVKKPFFDDTPALRQLRSLGFILGYIIFRQLAGILRFLYHSYYNEQIRIQNS